ncbi:MAG: glycosyltransferase N-terminal domain-containing protein [Candidatus Ozemobacteraceae bacterium]
MRESPPLRWASLASAFSQGAIGAALLAIASTTPLLARSLRRVREGFHHYFGGLPLPAGCRKNAPLIWIHGVSLGESLVGGTLMRALRLRVPSCRIGYTTTHPDVLATMQKRRQADVVGYFPLDFRPFWDRAFTRWHPKMALTIETDFWPGFSSACARHGIPLILINGRISEKLHWFYKFFPALGKAVFSNYALLLVQSSTDRDRLLEMGAEPRTIRIVGNIKIDMMPDTDSGSLDAVRIWKGNDALIILGSLHPSEFALFASFIEAVQARPNTRLLIAPRNLVHIEEWEKSLHGGNIKVIRRSQLTSDGAEDLSSAQQARLMLLDTMGELSSLYRLADAAFIGGSLDTSVGGHNPLESLVQGIYTVIGPHIRNFADLGADLAAAGGIELAADVHAIGTAIMKGLSDPLLREEQRRKAGLVLDRHRGALRRTMEALEAFLPEDGDKKPCMESLS